MSNYVLNNPHEVASLCIFMFTTVKSQEAGLGVGGGDSDHCLQSKNLTLTQSFSFSPDR